MIVEFKEKQGLDKYEQVKRGDALVFKYCGTLHYCRADRVSEGLLTLHTLDDNSEWDGTTFIEGSTVSSVLGLPDKDFGEIRYIPSDKVKLTVEELP